MADLGAKLLCAGVVGVWAALVATSAVSQMRTIAAEKAAVDASVRPGDDFYGHANGAWLKAAPPPDGLARTDTTSMLRAQNARRVRELVEQAAAPGGRALARKVGDYYASRLDRAAVEAKGMAPLAGELTAIAAITDRRGLAVQLGRSLRLDDGSNAGTESLWGVWVHQGFHDPDHYTVHLVQGGLGLGEAGDYLGADGTARRALYAGHVARVLAAAGLDRAQARAGQVVALETAIAATHASRADTDDVFKTDNGWSRADFAARAPGLDWDAFFAAAGMARAGRFVVWQPGALSGGAKLAAEQPLEAWKDYLAFHLVEHYGEVLPGAVADERRAFEAALAGAPSPPPLDARQAAIAATEAAFGDGVGRLYAERHFPPRAKAAAEAMVGNIRTAFRARIAGLGWMEPATRARAFAKLQALRVGLGYPQRWTDYSGLQVVRGDALGNLRRAEAFAYRRELAKLQRPVDADEWAGTLHPQMVGAVLNLSPNSMQFAAGLLQPPYFDADGDGAANYGSAGAGIAHEISHSFDEVGEIYDARGRLGHWQSAQDGERQRAATAPLAAQLDACCPAPGLCARGGQVLAESSADLVGLAVAHDAYLLSLHGQADAVKDGLSGEQRFFLAFARRWRRSQSDAALRRQIETDSHAPGQCRAELARNLDAWIQAFGVRPGDRLYLPPEARVRVW